MNEAVQDKECGAIAQLGLLSPQSTYIDIGRVSFRGEQGAPLGFGMPPLGCAENSTLYVTQ